MAQHARLSPSASGTWMVCPGSIPFAEKHGLRGTESVYAAVGTAVHEVSEECLRRGRDPSEWIGETVYGQTFTDDMAAHAYTYVAYVRSIEADLKLYEQRFKVRGVKHCSGTADTIYIDSRKKILGTVDLKTGAGVRVNAHENTQQMIYALGAYDYYAQLYDIRKIRVTIVQPPLNSIDSYEFTVDRLEEFRQEVIASADKIGEAESILTQLKDDSAAPDWIFVPGEKQCRFCRSKPRCPGLARMTQAAAVQEFSEAKKASHAYLAEWLAKKPLVLMFLNAIEEEVKARLHAGKRVDGYRLAVGRTNREIIDVAKTEHDLKILFGGSIYTTPVLKSVAQLEKIPEIKETGFDLGPYIKETKSPAVVPQDSPKKPWNPAEAARSDFTEEE